MRKITEDAVQAFNSGKSFHKANTVVTVEKSNNDDYKIIKMFLRGNLIAECNEEGFFVCDGGYKSRTTKERLNGFCNVKVNQKNFEWFLNGKEWDGNLTKVC
jgi:hypothetical protein